MSITEPLLPLLKLSSSHRIVFVSSSIGSLSKASDPESRYYGKATTEYRMSKAALNMLMNQYHVALKDEGFKVLGADPGLVITGFMDRQNQRAWGGVEGSAGGEKIASVIRGERYEDLERVCGVYGASPWYLEVLLINENFEKLNKMDFVVLEARRYCPKEIYKSNPLYF